MMPKALSDFGPIVFGSIWHLWPGKNWLAFNVPAWGERTRLSAYRLDHLVPLQLLHSFLEFLEESPALATRASTLPHT